MVLPAQLQQSMYIRGPIPEGECAQAAKKVKASIALMMLLCIARIMCASIVGVLQQDLFSSINLIGVSCMGIFVLCDDPHFQKIYNLLATSVFQSCHEQSMGGLGCVMPFALCCGMNCIMDMMFKIGVCFDMSLQPYGLILGLSMAAEGIGAFFGWQMYKVIRDGGHGMNAADMEMNQGGLGGLAGGLMAQPGQEGMQAPEPEEPALPAFEPFGGSGARLGGNPR